MASGTDVAMEAADLVLMRPTDLMDIPAALNLTRTIFRRIKFNLAWACIYNLIGLPIAMGLFLPLGVHMHPMMAGGAMVFSSFSVVANSLMLNYWGRPRWMNEALVTGRVSRTGGGRLAWITGLVAGLREVVTRRRVKKDQGYVPLQDMEVV